MKRIMIFLVLVVILTYGCSQTSNQALYVKPIDFSKSELAILELSEMTAQKLYLDYRIPENFKYLGFWFETYEDNHLVEDSGILHGLGDQDHLGRLVIEISDESSFQIEVKQLNEEGSNYSLSTFTIDKTDAVKAARGKSATYFEEAIEIHDEREIVLAAFVYDEGSGMLSLTTQDFQENHERVASQDLYVLMKLKLLEDFESKDDQ